MNHYLNGIALNSEAPNEYKEIIFGAGCFWGVERKFWQLDGVWLTSVGYAGEIMKIQHMNKFVMRIQTMQKL